MGVCPAELTPLWKLMFWRTACIIEKKKYRNKDYRTNIIKNQYFLHRHQLKHLLSLCINFNFTFFFSFYMCSLTTLVDTKTVHTLNISVSSL